MKPTCKRIKQRRRNPPKPRLSNQPTKSLVNYYRHQKLLFRTAAQVDKIKLQRDAGVKQGPRMFFPQALSLPNNARQVTEAPFSRRYPSASPTVTMFSASSSGISKPNSSSKAITSSTRSSESAPRSSESDAPDVTFSGRTPSSLTMISLTRASSASPLPCPNVDMSASCLMWNNGILLG